MADLLREKDEQIAGLMEEGILYMSLCFVIPVLARREIVKTRASVQQYHQETESKRETERTTHHSTEVIKRSCFLSFCSFF